MKRLLSTLLALALTLSLTTPAALAMSIWDVTAVPKPGPDGTYISGVVSSVSGGLKNFQKVRDYAPGVYADVPAGVWYEENLRTVYELGLTEDAPVFAPEGGLTLGEVVSLAVRVHRTYTGWSASNISDLQYAVNTGILGNGHYPDYSAPATRRSFAAIMAKALPGEGLRGMNAVTDGAIPDVPMSDPGASGVYALYRAGVFVGGDVQGTFRPDSLITRAAAAVALSRMLDMSLRQGISLLGQETYRVTLNPSSLNLAPGMTRTVIASVFPTNTTDGNIVWTSSEPRTAAVDQNGTVTAIQPGVAVISAISAVGAVGTCVVQVSEAYF